MRILPAFCPHTVFFHPRRQSAGSSCNVHFKRLSICFPWNCRLQTTFLPTPEDEGGELWLAWIDNCIALLLFPCREPSYLRCRFEHHLAGAALSSGAASHQLGEVTVRACAGPSACIVCRNNREDHKPTCRSRQFGEEKEDVGEAACVCVCVYVRKGELAGCSLWGPCYRGLQVWKGRGKPEQWYWKEREKTLRGRVLNRCNKSNTNLGGIAKYKKQTMDRWTSQSRALPCEAQMIRLRWQNFGDVIEDLVFWRRLQR